MFTLNDIQHLVSQLLQTDPLIPDTSCQIRAVVSLYLCLSLLKNVDIDQDEFINYLRECIVLSQKIKFLPPLNLESETIPPKNLSTNDVAQIRPNVAIKSIQTLHALTSELQFNDGLEQYLLMANNEFQPRERVQVLKN